MSPGTLSRQNGKSVQNESHVQMIFELDPKLKKHFEHVTVDEGKTMSEVLREFVKKYVDDHNKPVVY